MTHPLDPRLKDFRNFLYLIWQHLGLPPPTEAQYAIADRLQHGPDRDIIEAFRGVGKSWITCAFACHQLYLNPNINIEIVSASKSLADNNSQFIKQLIDEVPFLSHLKPRPGQRDSMVQFDVGPAGASKDPSVKSVGITGQITGTRADLIIGDDIEVPNNSGTQLQREKLAERVKEFDAILKPGGRIIYLGTPQIEFTLYNTLESRGYSIWVLPVRYPSLATMEKKYGHRLAPAIRERLLRDTALEGTITDPKRFDELDLSKRLASYGKAGFALQYMLDTSLSDAERFPLKLSDLIVMRLHPEMAPVRVVWGSSPELVLGDLPNVGLPGDHYHRAWAVERDPQGNPLVSPFTGSVMSIDPSGRGKDETTFSVVKYLNGFLYLTKQGGFLGGYSDPTLEALANTAKAQKVNRVIIEANFGDGMFTKLFQPWLSKVDYQVPVEEVKHSIQKEKRIIDTLEPVLMQHKLVVDQKVIEEDYRSTEGMSPEEALKYQLFYQMTRITKDAGSLVHDDRLDALAIAVGYWVDYMARDDKKEAEKHRAALRKAELERFMKHALGANATRERTWVRR